MSNENRRKLLKSIVTGSGAIVAGKNLPESWSRPVVSSVVLPAHAQTSVNSYSLREVLASIKPGSNSLLAGLVPSAHAGDVIGAYFTEYCVDVIGSMWQAAIRTTTMEGCLVAIWWAEGTVGGGAVLMQQNLCADFMHPAVTFEVKTNDASTVTVEIIEETVGQAGPTSIPAGTCSFGDPMGEQCCLVPGLYCGDVTGSSLSIEIEIGTGGEVTVRLDGVSGTSSVDPYCGGGFTVEDINVASNNFDVMGTVNCGESSISGTVTRTTGTGSPVVFNYTAGTLCEE